MNLVNNLTKSILATTVLTLSAYATTPVIKALKVNGEVKSVDTKSSLWEEATETEVALYPQTTIKLNDKNANELNKNNSAKLASVKAITNGENIAFKIVWKDDTKSVQTGNASKHNSFADGFAVQFPSKYTSPSKLPYIGMGSKDRPVVVYLQKAVTKHYEPNGNGEVTTQVNRGNKNAYNSKIDKTLETFDKKVMELAVKDYQRAFVSEGFRSMTQIKDNSTSFNATMSYEENTFSSNEWQGTISRALKDEYLNISSKPFPVAFAVWDGAKMGRDGLKNLSTWVTVELDDNKTSMAYNKAYDKNLEKANIKKGEELTQMNCASCHNYGNTNNAASPYMAPNLSNIGGYSTTAYLKESIIDPNAVIVPGYNRNAHKNFAWYFDDGQGGRMSAMPPFSHLKENEVNNIVAYLKTLKAKAE